MINYKQNYEKWLKFVKDEELLQELELLKENEEELEDRFTNYLSFGTSGLRGIIGVGQNRINVYTMSKTAQGISNYLKQNYEKSVVIIAYDNRKYSRRFAYLFAEIFAKNGIKSQVFKTLTPTPILSYSVRKLSATIGINITSSHNNKTYNGCKVVNQFGAQIDSAQAEKILKEIVNVNEFEVKTLPLEKAKEKKLIEELDTSLTDQYLEESYQFLYDYNYDLNKNLKITYTPLNGTGKYALKKGLNMLGFVNVAIPASQENPDENFTTVPDPNPELQEVFNEALKVAKVNNSDLIIATDPDCDRFGVMYKQGGKYIKLTGDQIGAILLNYVLENKQKLNQLTKHSFFVTSVVSSNLSEKIANQYNVKAFKTLTGFKYIGNKIENEFSKNKKVAPQNCFTFAYEESFGYLASHNIRDKDGIIPTLLISLLCAKLKSENKTLKNYLEDIYKKVGYTFNHNYSYEFNEIGGFDKIQNAVNKIRLSPLTKFGKLKVLNIIDYTDTKLTKLEKQNFIEYQLQDGAKVIIRPSGTEPKLKIYLTSTTSSEKKAKRQLKALQKSTHKILFKK